MAGRRPKRNNTNLVVSEEFRIRTEIELRNFSMNDSMTSYEFPCSLSSTERAWIHNYVKIFSFASKSHGKDPNRRLIITKKKNITNRGEATITLSEENLQMIQTFLNKYPYHRDRPDTNLQPRLQNYENIDTNMGQLTYGIPQLPTFGLNSDLVDFRRNLPIWPMREKIMEHIIANQVVIIKGETGSGKTTQIPQFILDYSVSVQQECRIICTQPRRISAISVAERVAQERGERTGQTVGFHIRLESCVGPKTSLIYCTNGILLRTLMNGDTCLNSITHIIVDEIHERDRFSDFLLICLRECLVNYPNVRLILMSATIDVTTFKDYFNNAPVIFVRGRLHHVERFFLDEILPTLEYESSAMKELEPRERAKFESAIIEEKKIAMLRDPDMTEEVDDCIEECFSKGTEISFINYLQYLLNDDILVDYQHSVYGYTGLMAAAAHGNIALCEQLLHLGANITLRSYREKLSAAEWAYTRNHDLINEYLNVMEPFFTRGPLSPENPQTKEENRFKLSLYNKTVSDQNIDYDLLLSLLLHVHSSTSTGGILVFLAGYDDIVTVRDRILNDRRFMQFPYEIFVLHGMMQISDQHKVFNPLKDIRKIILSTNIAETSITIDDVTHVIDSGKVKEKTYDAELCLQTKMLAPKDTQIAEFLCRAIEPPSSLAVKNAIKHLQEIGALNDDESLTVLGQHLVDLPAEPRLAKMLIFSVIFKCIDPILTIVAFLSYRDPFVLPNSHHQKSIALARKKEFALGTFSDHMILLKVFQFWQDARLASNERYYCTSNNLSSATMEMVVKIRSQLLAQLRAAGFVNTKPPGDIRELNENSNNWAVIKAVLTAGLYPNIAYIDRNTMKIRTRKEKKVSVSMTSCLRPTDRGNNDTQYLRMIPTNWLIFEELSRNNTHHNIRSVTAITPLTVALFSNDIDTRSDSDETDSDDEISLSNKWFVFDGAPYTLSMINDLRAKMNTLISKKITHPHKQYTLYESNLLHTITAVLQREDLLSNLTEPVGIGQRPKIMNCANGTANEESFKHRLKARKFRTVDASDCRQVLAFEPVIPQFYNRFVPGVMYIPPEEEEPTSNSNSREENDDNVENLCEVFDSQLHSFPFVENNFSQLGIAQYLGSDLMAELNYPWTGGSNASHLDEACAAVPGNEPTWKSDIHDPNRIFYALVKTITIRSIEVSMNKHSWTFAPYVEKKLRRLYESGKVVILFFCVQHIKAFQGFARLIKMPSLEDANYSIQSSLEWLNKAEVPFAAVRYYCPEQYGDGDMLDHALGVQLIQIYSNLPPPTVEPQEPFCVGAGRPITKKLF